MEQTVKASEISDALLLAKALVEASGHSVELNPRGGLCRIDGGPWVRDHKVLLLALRVVWMPAKGGVH